MSPRVFSLLIATVYGLSAALGLVAPALQMPAHSGTHSLAIGLIPLNPVHNLAHLIIALIAATACVNATASTSVARGLALFLGFVAVVGLLPPGSSSASLSSISTEDIWLHAVTALLAAFVGFSPACRPRARRPLPRAA